MAQRDAPQVSFSQIGNLRNESVDSTGVFNAVKQGIAGVDAARKQKAAADANQRTKDYIVEDSDTDVAALEQAFERSQTVSEFVTSEPDRGPGTEPGFVTQLRRQGGSGAIAAELASRRAHNTRLKDAPAEDIPFLQQQFHNRGSQASSKQFLTSLAATEAKEVAADSKELQDTVKSMIGIDLAITDDASFVNEWVNGDPKWDNLKLTLSETQDATLQRKQSENNPQGVAIRVGTWVNETTAGLAQQMLRVGNNASRPEVEARAAEALAQARTQLEVKLGYATKDQADQMREAFEKQAAFITRIADGSADRAEISTFQARQSLANSRLNAKKIKAETKLSESQLDSELLKQTRENLDNIVKANDRIQEIQDAQAIVESGLGASDVANMTPLERMASQDPQALNSLKEGLYDVVLAVAKQGEVDASGVDIGPAGQVSLTGDIENLGTNQKIDAVTGYLAMWASGVDPFKNPEDGEKGLNLMATFGAQEVAKMDAVQRQEAFRKLEPIMNTPEFAERAAQAPGAFKPWVNLVVSETNQRAANMLGALSTDLVNDGAYRSAVLAVKPQLESPGFRRENIARLQAQATPDYFLTIAQSEIPKAIAQIDVSEAKVSTDGFDTIVSQMEEHGQRYLDFIGKDEWNARAEQLDNLKESMSGEGKKAVDKVIAAGRDYYGAKEKILQARVLNAETPADVYSTLKDVAVVDQDHFDATGEYRLKTSDTFKGAFAKFPQVVQSAEVQLANHNNGTNMGQFRTGLSVLKNTTGAATIQDTYSMFRVARPNRRNLSLSPDIQNQVANNEVFQP